MRAPRRKQTCCQLEKQRFAPRAGLPHHPGRPSPKPGSEPLPWEARPAAKADLLPARKQKLRPEGGPPTPSKSPPDTQARLRTASAGGAPRGESRPAASPKATLRPEGGTPTLSRSPRPQARLRSASVGGAPRGESRPAASSKSNASPRGRASHTIQVAPDTQARLRTASVGGAPRGESRPAASSKTTLRPKGGPPTLSKSSQPPSPAPNRFRGRRAPRRKLTCCQLESKSFTPRAGLPHHPMSPQPQARLRTASVGGAPRGESRPAANPKAKFRPEGGPPTLSNVAPPPSPAPNRFCGRRAPRRKQTCCQLEKQRFAPRAGLPHYPGRPSPQAPAPNRFRGRRAPRRKQTCCQLEKQRFAPRAGLPHYPGRPAPSPAPNRFCGRRAPRRKQTFCQLEKATLRPGRASCTNRRPALLGPYIA